jgi:WD40 repeat protein
MLMTAALSHTGKVLFTAGFEGTINMYDAPTGRQLATIAGHTACVTGLALSSTGEVVVSSSEDGSVRAWQATSGEQRFKFVGHEDSVTCVAISPNDKLVASGSDDNSIIVWSMETGESVGQLIGHKGPVWSVAFAPDGRRIISTSDDGRVVAWSSDKVYRFLASLATFDFAVKVARYSPDGQLIGAGGDDGALYLFDNTGDPHAKLEGHTDCCWALSFSPTAPLVVTGSADRTIRVWDHSACVEVAAFHWHSHELRSLAFSKDGSMLVSAACDKTAKISAVFLDSTSPITMESFRPSSVSNVWFCADRSIVYTDTESLNVVDALTGDFRRRWESREALTCCYFPPKQHSGKIFLAGSAEYRAIVLQEGAVKQSTRLDAVHMVHEHGESPVVSVHTSADGAVMATVTADCTLRIFQLVSALTKGGSDTVEAQLEHEVPCDDFERVNCVRCSRDGEIIVLACGDATIRVFASVDHAEIMLLEGHRSAVLGVALSPDQRIILSGSTDKTVRLWDATAGVEVMALTGHLAPVTCVELAPSAQEAYSGSLDGTVRVWDVVQAAQTAAIVTHQVACICVSDDTKVLVSGGFDGTVRVMTRIDLNWCVVQQIGSRRHASLIGHQLRGVDEAVEKTKAVNYLLESLSTVKVSGEKKKKKKKKKREDDADEAAPADGPAQEEN